MSELKPGEERRERERERKKTKRCGRKGKVEKTRGREGGKLGVLSDLRMYTTEQSSSVF